MRFVSPETVRITLKNGDWIDIKKELTVGEDKRYRTAGFRRVSQGTVAGDNPEISVDFSLMALARVETYLVDWSAKKPDGKDLPVSRQAIEALATDDFDEIDNAIQDHIAKTLEEKKPKTGNVTPLSPAM